MSAKTVFPSDYPDQIRVLSVFICGFHLFSRIL